MDRRSYLGAAATLGLGGLLGYNGNILGPKDSSIYSDRKSLVKRYGKEQVKNKELYDKDLVLEGIYVEGEEFSDTNKRFVEDFFSEQELDVAWLDNTYEYPREWFFRNHGPDVEKVLSEDGLYGDMVDELNDEFMQAFFVPGFRRGENKGKIRSGDCAKASDYVKAYNGCYSLKDERFVLTDPGGRSDEINEVRYAWVVLHEAGHALNLRHRDDGTIMDSSVFPETYEELNYSGSGWETVRETLGER